MKLVEQVDMIEFKEYREVDLDEEPVIALACGHFFTAQTLDGMLESQSFLLMLILQRLSRFLQILPSRPC